MVGLWYAVPTLVIIGKGFPLSPHGEAECQVSMHTHPNTNRKNHSSFVVVDVNVSGIAMFSWFVIFASWSLDFLGRAKRPTKIHEIPWMNQYTVILSKRRKISAYCTDPRVWHKRRTQKQHNRLRHDHNNCLDGHTENKHTHTFFVHFFSSLFCLVVVANLRHLSKMCKPRVTCGWGPSKPRRSTRGSKIRLILKVPSGYRIRD